METANENHIGYELALNLGTTTGERVGSYSKVARPYFREKVLFDRVVAILLLGPVLPTIAILAYLVRLTSRGPGIYQQVRSGKDGREFTMYKIRTMTIDAEDKTGPVWTRVQDPRVTPIGRVLRWLHLDELPQLFNVLKGEMSFVGPRPERPEFVNVLDKKVPHYRKRLAVLPGITGLAQINLPPDTDTDSVRRKLLLDLEYVATASWWMDLRILACTFSRLCGVPGSFALSFLRLRRDAVLSSDSPSPNASGTAGTPAILASSPDCDKPAIPTSDTDGDMPVPVFQMPPDAVVRMQMLMQMHNANKVVADLEGQPSR